jgi:hypothetical protein
MKRFVIFNFPPYEGAWLERAIQGSCDDLGGVEAKVEESGDLQALDMETGAIWGYDYDSEEWRIKSNVGSFSDLD